MASEADQSVGATFELLRRQRQVSYAHVARAGGLRRNTVWTIAKGSSRNIGVSTLAKLAVGLATYVYLPGIDREYLWYALSRLGQAADMGNLRDEQLHREVVALMVALVGDESAAAAWVDLIVSLRELSAEQIATLSLQSPRERHDEDSTL